MVNLSLSGLLEGNFFNFLLLVILIGILAWKVDFAGMIASAKAAVEDRINLSEERKKEAEKSLEYIKEEVKNLPQELSKIIKEAENTVEGYKEKTQAEIAANSERIEKNALKIMENEVQKVSAALRKELSKNSIEAAKEKIISKLGENDSLHRKYIADAIDKIEEINI